MDGAVAGPGTRVGSPALLPVDWSQFHGVDLYAQHHASCRGGDFFDGLSLGLRVQRIIWGARERAEASRTVPGAATHLPRQRGPGDR